MRTTARILGHAAVGAMLLLGFGAGTAAQAAILPDTIGYEGFLRDAGVPVNGPKDITFRIYTQDSGGSPVWTEVQNAVPVTNGVFQVRLGSVISLSDENTTGIDFDRPLFLSVQVDGGAEMTPRLALNASPYSFAGRLLGSTVNVDCGNGGNLAEILDQAANIFDLEIDISGTCVGNLLIDRDKVIIRSSNGTGVITVAQPSAPDPVNNPANAVITVSGAQGVVLENVKVQGPGGDPTGMNGIVLADNSQLTVRGGTAVVGHAGDGIKAIEASSLDVWGSTVGGPGSDPNQGNGITLYSGSHADVEQGSVVEYNAKSGIVVSLGSSLDVRGSTVRYNSEHGILASWSSAVRVRESSLVEQNGTAFVGEFRAGLFVNEGSSARVENSTIATSMPNADDGLAIAVYRGSSLRLTGTNTITAPGPGAAVCPPDCPYGGATAGGMAIDAEMNSTVRQDSGKTIITGQVFSHNLTTVDLRNVEMTGNLVASSLSTNVKLRDDTADSTPTINGAVVVSGSGELSIANAANSKRALINGDVYCQNDDADVYGGHDFVDEATQGYVNCEHVSADLSFAMVQLSPPNPVTNSGGIGSETIVTYQITIKNESGTGPGNPKVQMLGTNVNLNAFAGGGNGFLNGFNFASVPTDCNINGQSVYCFIDVLEAQEVVTETFSIALPAGGDGDLSINANAYPSNPDPNTTNNNPSVQTTVVLTP